MANRVGPKGQVVIEKEIRDKLGIGPGSVAIQRLVDDHVEIYFLPPRHNRSLLGAARPFVKRWPRHVEIDDSESGWAEAVGEKFKRLDDEATDGG
jgi:AbrB family looped-hinge helix DNA binding protein